MMADEIMRQGVIGLADIVITFDVDSAWSGGFGGSILIENQGVDAVDGWELEYSGGPVIDSLWNGDWFQLDGSTTIVDLGWNGVIAPGGSVSLGYNGQGEFVPDVTDLLFNGAPATIAYGAGAGGDDGSDGGDDSGGDDGSDGGDEGEGPTRKTHVTNTQGHDTDDVSREDRRHTKAHQRSTGEVQRYCNDVVRGEEVD